MSNTYSIPQASAEELLAFLLSSGPQRTGEGSMAWDLVRDPELWRAISGELYQNVRRLEADRRAQYEGEDLAA